MNQTPTHQNPIPKIPKFDTKVPESNPKLPKFNTYIHESYTQVPEFDTKLP